MGLMSGGRREIIDDEGDASGAPTTVSARLFMDNCDFFSTVRIGFRDEDGIGIGVRFFDLLLLFVEVVLWMIGVVQIRIDEVGNGILDAIQIGGICDLRGI